MLVVSEQGQEGKEYSTLIPCEAWGKRAETAGELEAGALVLFEGKLRKRQKSEGQWELVVSGFEVTPIMVPTSALTGSSN
jgi:single-stranded DNA-binding protein